MRRAIYVTFNRARYRCGAGFCRPAIDGRGTDDATRKNGVANSRARYHNARKKCLNCAKRRESDRGKRRPRARGHEKRCDITRASSGDNLCDLLRENNTRHTRRSQLSPPREVWITVGENKNRKITLCNVAVRYERYSLSFPSICFQLSSAVCCPDTIHRLPRERLTFL